MEWISIKDRLPYESGWYWCYIQEVTCTGISKYQWNCYYNKDINIWSSNLETIRPTDWMPLPEPPQE